MPRQVVLNLHLVQLIAVIIRQCVPLLVGFLLLHIREVHHRLTQLHILVEPRHLQLLQVILCLTHDVRNPLGTARTARPEGNNHIFSRHEDGRLPTQARVLVHLLEGRAR